MKAILTNVAISTAGCALAGLFWIPGALPFDSLAGREPTSTGSIGNEIPVATRGREGSSGPGEVDARPNRRAEREAPVTGAPVRRRGTKSLVTKVVTPERTLLPRRAGRIAVSSSVETRDRAIHIPPALAFAALAEVGKDEAAEKTWRLAIRDPSLPPGIRSDLIEDLNDTGYPDPDHLTQADLPLILHRLALIERLYPHAMDRVNADAFEEAYKDLLQMWLALLRKQDKGGK